jgi:hypothetical protein
MCFGGGQQTNTNIRPAGYSTDQAYTQVQQRVTPDATKPPPETITPKPEATPVANTDTAGLTLKGM